MSGVPYMWEFELVKRVALIAVHVVPEHREKVEAVLDQRLKQFEGRERLDDLIDEIEAELRLILGEMDSAGWVLTLTLNT